MGVSNILRSLIHVISRKLPIKKNKLVFVSHLGKNYSCNPKCLCEYILRNAGDKFELVFLYDPTICAIDDFPKGVRTLSIYSKRFIYDMATCGFLISNTRIPEWFGFNPRKNQYYIQTWHSSLRLKKIEKDANLGFDYEEWAMKDSKKISAIVSGCDFSSNIFKKSFWYDGPLLKVGTPRIDYLLNINENEVLKIKKKASLNRNAHYVLYAPTFRSSGNIDVYNIDYEKVIGALSVRFGGEWNVLFRIHPNLRGIVNVKKMPSYVVDVSGYRDIQELIAISDVMITDYSSCMFDMAFAKKPCFLYVSDLEQYISNERGLYFDITKLPFPMAKTNEELLTLIKGFDKLIYNQSISEFLSEVGSYEHGNACQQILKYIEGQE